LILVRKLGVPAEPELAMGAVVDGAVPIVVRNDDVIRITGVGETEFNATRNAELAEIERRRRRYLRDRERADVAGRTAIVRRSARLCAQPACANRRSLSLQCR
jgi:putative phosphoribosyl transferase